MKHFLLFCFLSTSFILHAQNFVGDEAEINAILEKVDSFSSYYMAGNYEALANSYSENAHIFPSGSEIITGKEAIMEKWIPPAGIIITHHDIMPEEIVIQQDIAYDWGYYEGQTKKEEELISWRGKYVIVWKKVEGDWKIYLDIWNRVSE